VVSELRPLEIRRRLGTRTGWEVPEPFGPNGWVFDEKVHPLAGDFARRIIVSADYGLDEANPAVCWVHASVSVRDEKLMPTYEDLKLLHHAVWGEGHAYQCFVPSDEHVNIRSNALHLWGRLDGQRVLPDFGRFGTI
jgi:hypothetical protein